MPTLANLSLATKRPGVAPQVSVFEVDALVRRVRCMGDRPPGPISACQQPFDLKIPRGRPTAGLRTSVSALTPLDEVVGAQSLPAKNRAPSAPA